MAAKAGLSAGRVYLQVVPSYKGFMETLRRDAPKIAEELSKGIQKQVDRESGALGKAYGKKIAEGVGKGISSSDGLDEVSRQLDRKLKKAIDAVGRDTEYGRIFHGLREELRKSGADVEALERSAKNARNALAAMGGDSTNSRFSRNAQAAVNAIDGISSAERRRGRAHSEAEEGSNVAERGLLRLRKALIGGRNDAQDGANAFRFFNFAVLGLALVGPALVPMLAALGGGLALLGPILLGVGAGFGVAALAASGLGEAVKALQAQQDATSGSSVAYQRAVVSAARAVADARRGVANATRNAAEANRNALRAQEDAERRLQRAQRDAAQAQRDLTEARKEAKRELADLDNQIAQNALDERQAVIDLFNAYNTYGAVQSDGGATNLQREEADIGLQQAELNLKRIREEEKRLAEEKKKADKGGVNGTDTVKRAEERLTDALERQKEARRDLAEASRNVDRVRADGARSVADAQRNLTRAQEDYNYALQGGAAAIDATNRALEDLSPAGRRFARFLLEAREGMVRLRKVAQEGMLPGVQEALERIIRVYAPGMYDFVGRTSELLGDLSRQAGETFTNPVWREFFSTMNDSAQTFISDAGRGTLDWLTGFASLATVAAPYAERLSNALAGVAERFRSWAGSERGQESFRGFLDYVERVGPKVSDFLGSIGRALGNVGKALAPVGEQVLLGLTRFFDAIANMDPGTLRIILVGVISIIGALQIASGLLAVISLTAAIAGSTFLILAAAIAGLALAFVLLGGFGEKFDGQFLKPLGDKLGKIASIVKDELVYTFEKALRPALKKIGDAFKKDVLPSLTRFLDFMTPIISILVQLGGVIVRQLIGGVGNVIAGFFKILGGLMDFIVGVFTLDWKLAWNGIKKIFSGLFQGIIGILQIGIFSKIPKILGFLWTKLSKPFKVATAAVIGFFRDLVDSSLKKLRGMREKVGEIARGIGSKLKEGLKTAFEWIALKPVNLLIRGVNRIASWVGLGGKDKKVIDELTLPKGWATGGYTGRGGKYEPAGIVHRDEFVVRKEARQRFERENPGFLDHVNRTGRAPGYAGGGRVYPVRGSKRWTTYPGHTGIDFARPEGTPVYAATGGRIVATPRLGYSYGHHIRQSSAGGTSIYAHLSRILVKVGDLVAAGQRIGLVGSTGNSTGPHLHFERRPPGTDVGTGAWLSGAKTPSGKGSILDRLSRRQIGILRNPVDYLKDKAVKPFEAVGGLKSSFGIPVIKGLLKKIKDGLIDKFAPYLKAAGVGFKAGLRATPVGRGLASVLGGSGGHNLYDRGGYLQPGLSMVMNRTGRPEPVLTSKQWDAIMSGKADGGSITVQATLNGSTVTAAEFSDEITWKMRKARRQIANRRKRP